MFNSFFIIIQLFFTIIVGMYFWGELRNRSYDKDGINEDSRHVMERLNQMRRISLTEPLTEKTRPKTMDEIIGQNDGIEALKIALCGKNPKHVIIYGPPGVGKTAASRVAMEYAKMSEGTPFKKDAKFVEVDATIMQYDERSIADPLIGSVHDPIYQGAGAYGASGVPQPKEGAVSKAHGGILFIDEIGELQPIQMNRLLKVLEDRYVKFESAYYSSTNKKIPRHIHDIFQNGVPADFRLIGATTRSPEEIPSALRSRCTEIFFNQLCKNDILKIVENAIKKLDINVNDKCKDLICRYCASGRDAVSLTETLASKLKLQKRDNATREDIEWIIDAQRLSPTYDYRMPDGKSMGKVHGLAVTGGGEGLVITIEAACEPASDSKGFVRCGGITEQETIEKTHQKFSKTSTAKTAVDNVMTVLKTVCGIDISKYNIYINIPGGMPVDGPSAGIAIFVCCYCALMNIPVSNKLALTGELSIKGEILPVGGIKAKTEAAAAAGAETIIIPKGNYSKQYEINNPHIKAASNIDEVITFITSSQDENTNTAVHIDSGDLAIAQNRNAQN